MFRVDILFQECAEFCNLSVKMFCKIYNHLQLTKHASQLAYIVYEEFEFRVGTY